MPTAFTHAFVGAIAPHLGPQGLPKLRLAIVCALASAAPDLDIFAFWLDIPYEAPLGHRGLTHSLFFALAVGPLLAWLVMPRRDRSPRKLWQAAAIVSSAIATHGLLDAATDAGRGIGLLIPFTSERFFWPFRPLETSPISPAHFFDGHAFVILANEFVWVWLPVGALALAVWLARRVRSARGELGAGAPPSGASGA